ncbi:MAG: RDD family protein [Candidatus Dormibacteria bacterium]
MRGLPDVSLPPPPTGSYPAAPPPPPAPGRRFAGFWIRVAAYLIDDVLTSAVVYGLLFALKPFSCVDAGDGTCVPRTTTYSAIFFVLVALPALYLIVTWATGGTIGQRILGMRIVNAETGRPLGIGRSLLRFVGYVLSVAVIFIGLIWVGFDARKQGWHDKIAGSLVVRA